MHDWYISAGRSEFTSIAVINWDWTVQNLQFHFSSNLLSSVEPAHLISIPATSIRGTGVSSDTFRIFCSV